MAEKINYYGWLGLSVERFESDPTVLAPIVEKKINEWSLHKCLAIQNRAQIYGDKIRTAINNATEWEKIYLEYQFIVSEKILNMFILVADNFKLNEVDVSKVASSSNVSVNYAEKVAKNNGYSIGSEDNIQQKSAILFELADLKPKSELKLRYIQDKIVELGFSNLMELLASPDYLGVVITTTSDSDKLNKALVEFKNKWSRISATGPKATQRALVNNICVGFTSFLKTNSFNEYIAYLKYFNVKDILISLQAYIKATGVTKLNERAFIDYVNQIFYVVEDRDKSYSILMNFCKNKGVALWCNV